MALRLCSRLDSALDVTSPGTGTGGAEIGSPTYVPAYLNKGILSDIDHEGCTFPTGPNNINFDKGTIEFWTKVFFASTHTDSHWLFTFIGDPAGPPLAAGLRLFYSKFTNRFHVEVFKAGALVTDVDTGGFSWSSGAPIHFGVVWDRQGNDIGAGKTLVIFINNVEMDSSIVTWLTANVKVNLYIGLRLNNQDHSDAAIDNLKTYDHCKIDFSDRYIVCNERPPLAPTDLLCEGKVNPSGVKDLYFSAIYHDETHKDAATHYRIEVNTASDFTGTVMWDSGQISMTSIHVGERCNDVPYGAGSFLVGGVTYYWRIRFWDRAGSEGKWSEELAYFSLFDPGGNGPPPGGDGPTPPGGHPAFKPAYKLTVGKNVIQCESDKGNLLDCNFTLRRDGGCAEFDFTLGAPYFKPINLGDEVNIYVFGQTTQWFRGRIMERDHPGSSNRARKYSGYGHFEQLNGCDLVDVEYGAGFAIDDLRDAVIDILDTDVRPYTSLITNDNSKIADPLYTITHVKFDKVKPIDALSDLAELAQNYEFGVDEVGDFYFRANSTAILHKKWVGKHVKSLLPTENIRTLRNFLYLEGGQLTAGTNYDSAVWDPASIVAYGRRADKVTIPSNMDTSEIARWGNDLLAKTKDPITKVVIIGVDVERTETRIWPRGQMRCTSEDGRYVFDKTIIAVTYHLTPAGVTSADVQLGEKLASLRQQIRDVEKKVIAEQEQLASDVLQLATGGGVTLLGLGDTPGSYVGGKGKILKVNDAENVLEFDLHRQFDNLCRNAAFASRSGGVTTEPDEWELENTPTIAYAAVDTGYGDHAIKITADAADEGIKITLTHLKPSTKYQVFARVKVDAGDIASLITTGAATNINIDSTSAVWENIEGEFITDAGATDVVIKLVAEANTDVAYFCGITCVEGDIPPGNFIRRVNETIVLTTSFTDPAFDGDAFSSSEADIDLSAFGNGCPPKIKEVLMTIWGNDSASAAVTCNVGLGPGGIALDATGKFVFQHRLLGVPNNEPRALYARVPCDANGDVRYRIVASGVNTFDLYISIWGYVLGE